VRAVPQRGIDLGDHRAARADREAVERPEVQPVARRLTKVAQPRHTRVRRLRDRARNVEVEHRLRARADLDESPPVRVAGARGTVAGEALADDVHPDAVVAGRPVAAEVVEERGPVGERNDRQVTRQQLREHRVSSPVGPTPRRA